MGTAATLERSGDMSTRILREVREPGVHQSISVHHDIYGVPTPSARHLQGDPPESLLQAWAPQNPCSGDQLRGPTRRGGACFTRDLGLTSRTFSLDVRARPSRDRHRSHPAERGSPPLRPGRESPSRSSAPRTWGECQPFRRARSKPLRCRSAVRRRISRSAIRGHTRSPPCRCDGISSPARAHYATVAHCPPVCSRWVFNSALEPSFVRDNPAILRDRRGRGGQGHGGNPRSIAKDIAPDAGRGRNHQTTWPRSAQPRQVSTTT